MPTYEYECAACDATYELRQGFDAGTTHTCEECGKGVAKRILHAPRVVFKGSGWYATDSRKSQSAISDSPESSDNSSAPAESAPASTSAGSGEKSSSTSESSAAS